MLIKIIGTLLFIIAMVFYVRCASRKGTRDYETMIKADRDHDQWMIDFRREFPRERH